MNRLWFVLIFLLIFSLSHKNVLAEKEGETLPVEIEAKQLDRRAEILASYLAQYDSPLQYHAQTFIDAANQYNLDWRLLPSIAGVESTFGKFIPGGYNGWGWGVYGTQAIYFKSWKEAIFTVSKGLRENYLDKGLTDPDAINKAYAESPYWAGKVNYFMADLEKFAYQFAGEKVSLLETTPKIAAISATLASRSLAEGGRSGPVVR